MAEDTTTQPFTWASHRSKNILLIALSLAFLPIDTAIVCFTYARLLWSRHRTSGEAVTANDGAQWALPETRKTILVTGVGMAKGLALARLFHQAGHRVVGADFSANACGRVSNSLDAFHVLRRPHRGSPELYLDSMLKIIASESIDLWVSCSGVASAVEDGIVKEVIEARTSCKAVQFDVERTKILHEKGSFMDHTRSIGLKVPESFLVTSKGDLITALERETGLSQQTAASKKSRRRFIVKSVGMNDKSRGDMQLLPLATERQTLQYISRIDALGITQEDPWLLQEFIDGGEYCTHSLVVRGEVKAFLACPSSELLMHYVALDHKSPLTIAMLDFTKKQAASFGKGFTGHLSFDFMVLGDQEAPSSPDQLALYPIECNPRAHTALALFANTPKLVDAYLSVLSEEESAIDKGIAEQNDGHDPNFGIVTPDTPERYYWVGHDLTTLLLIPTAQLLLLRLSPVFYLKHVSDFITHLLTWSDGTYVSWDPLPWWWLYHVYWPSEFWASLTQAKNWSRLNVSTTKMFESD